MPSRSTSHSVQPSSVHASQTSGGCRGSTPTPSTRLSSSIPTAQCGTAALSPSSMQSPGRGASEKHITSLPSARSAVRSATGSPLCWTTRCLNSQGTTVSSCSVAKTAASSLSVRVVATSVPSGSRIGSSCGAESQNVTSVRAAEGGNSVMPTRSRNARWFFSGTRLSR